MTKTCPDCHATVLSTSQPDYECENCIGMIEHGCYCQAMGATRPGGPAALAATPDEDDAVLDSYAEENQRLSDRIIELEAAATPAVGGEDRHVEALRVISTMAICEEGETAEQRALIVDACREVAANALAAQPASPLRGREPVAWLYEMAFKIKPSDEQPFKEWKQVVTMTPPPAIPKDGVRNVVPLYPDPPHYPLRGRESVRAIAHRHCTCTCRGDPAVLQNHTNLCDSIADAILEYAVLSFAAPEQPAALPLAVRLRDESGPPLPQMIAQRRAQLSQEQPAATPDIVKMYSDMERAKNARIGELEEALGKAVLSAPLERQLTENECDAIAHAKYQCDCSSPSDPEVRFDYEVIRTLLSLIPVPREAT